MILIFEKTVVTRICMK